MRIVHFSDIHVGHWPAGAAALLDKRVLGALNHCLRRRRHFRREFLARAIARIKLLAPDWVLCTGDITTVGDPAEFADAAQALAPLVDFMRGRFVYIPGNHDAYVRAPACRNALAQTFSALNGDRWQLGDLPQEFGDGQVSFLALDECAPSGWLLSTGRLTATTRERLQTWLAADPGSATKRVLVGHFPARDARHRPLGPRRRLQGADIIADALSRGQVDVALCGHIHTPFRREIPGGGLEVCAGSLTQHGKINVLDWVPDAGRFRQTWEDVSQDGDRQIPLSSVLQPAVAVE